MNFLNITLVQLNSHLGRWEFNLKKILAFWKKFDPVSHLVIFPELALSGSFPKDLLLRPDFWAENERTLSKLIGLSKHFKSMAIVGSPFYMEKPYNSALVIGRGKIWGIYNKKSLNLDLNEPKYFSPGATPLTINLDGFTLGISMGKDIQEDSSFLDFYKEKKIRTLIILSSEPYEISVSKRREKFLSFLAEQLNAYVAFVNLCGAQDEFIFEGRSLVINPQGVLEGCLKYFEEDVDTYSLKLELTDGRSSKFKRFFIESRRNIGGYSKEIQIFSKSKSLPFLKGKLEAPLKSEEEIYKALVTSLREYVNKKGFERVVLGLSGGMDSSLVACIAVDALGSERVVGVFMPSPFTSHESKEDAETLSKNLGIELLTFPISEIFENFRKTFGNPQFDVADENLQARIRANLLFYLSNKEGFLVLCTSNKSEAATGYGTLYGDIAGGFAPLIDVYKTTVYKLAHFRNTMKPDLPNRIFTKPPSAELKPNQTDQEVLPPYDILDGILRLYLEENLSAEMIIKKGFDRETVEKVIIMVKRAEFKRKQSPLGPKITKRPFFVSWNYPLL